MRDRKWSGVRRVLVWGGCGVLLATIWSGGLRARPGAAANDQVAERAPAHKGALGDPRDREWLQTLLTSGEDDDARVAIRALAAIGDEASARTLTAIMNDDGWPDGLRLEAGGRLLKTGRSADLRAAIAGLAAIGGDESVAELAAILHDADRTDEQRLLAAQALGQIDTAKACDALLAALPAFPEPDVQAQIFEILGHFPFAQIEPVWKQTLEAPDTPSALRAAVAGALAYSSRDAVPFLWQLAALHGDSGVREMAAWALAMHGPDGVAGPALAELARNEPEADVRRRLYEALPCQAQNPAASLLPDILAESDLAARVAGFNALGDAVRRDPESLLTETFNTQIVPELTRIALAPESVNIRMRAVFALRRAETAATFEALTTITTTSTRAIAQAALNGLRFNTQEHP